MDIEDNIKNGLVLENVSKNYEDNIILNDINLQVRKGEFVCIIGNSGCGKSTLLNVMAGIEKPSSGRVYINGIERTKSNNSQLQKLIGVVFQQDRLMEWRTVEKNVRFPLEIFHTAVQMKQKAAQKFLKKNHEEKIDFSLNRVGLLRFRNLYPCELSGGMKMRAAIARTLVNDSEFIFLDQPFDALDAITRRTLEIDMIRLWKETQKTIVMITSSIEEAVLLGSRILVISLESGSIKHEITTNIAYEDRVEALCGNLKNAASIENMKQNLRKVLNTQRKQYFTISHERKPGICV
jgi:NitT/TauT family transport system ATP-binding protein